MRSLGLCCMCEDPGAAMRMTHATGNGHAKNEEKMNVAAARLAAVRAAMAEQGLDGFLVPRGDEHLSEYVPPSAARLAWLTGFTGSAGVAVVLKDKAAVFTDGRYTLQLEAQTDPALWERRHITDEPPGAWTAAQAGPGARIGFDPMLMSEGGHAAYRDSGVALVAANPNPVDVPGPTALRCLPAPRCRIPSAMRARRRTRSGPRSARRCARPSAMRR